MEYPDFLKEAAAHNNPNWIYFHCWSGIERVEMDYWLVKVNHPLAYEPGTNEHRFKALVKEIKENTNESS